MDEGAQTRRRSIMGTLNRQLMGSIDNMTGGTYGLAVEPTQDDDASVSQGHVGEADRALVGGYR